MEEVAPSVEGSLSCNLLMEVLSSNLHLEKATLAVAVTIHWKGRRDSERPDKQLNWSGLACVKWARETQEKKRRSITSISLLSQ